jgi:HEAT repeat protein
MSRRSAAGVALALLGLGAEAEPRYDGRPASAWVADLGEPDPKARAAAAEALGEMHAHPPAAPALSAALTDRRGDAASADGARRAAAVALGGLGPSARDAVPALRDALYDDDAEVVAEAAVALSAIDADAARRAGLKERDTQHPEGQPR